MIVHEALQKLFPLAIPTNSAKNITDIRQILIGKRKNTVYKAAFSRHLGKSITKDAFDYLANELNNYTNSTTVMSQIDFDEWHKNVCVEFLNKLNGKSPCPKKYGKAQKALNMAGKYLYCCSDSISLEAKFTHFHMALDGYTYIGTSKTAYPLSFYRDIVMRGSLPIGTIKSWSQLDNTNYDNAVKNIRDFISAYPHTFNEYLDACHAEGLFSHISSVAPDDDRVLTPFESEFFIWEICKTNKASVFTTLY